MGHPVDPCGESRHDGEVVGHQRAHEALGAREPVARGLPGAHDGDRARARQDPPALVVEQLDGMGRIAQPLGVLARAVHPHAEPLDLGFLEPPLREHRAGVRLRPGHEVRRDAARMPGEPLRQRLERGVRLGPQGLVGAHLVERRDGARFEIRVFECELRRHPSLLGLPVCRPCSRHAGYPDRPGVRSACRRVLPKSIGSRPLAARRVSREPRRTNGGQPRLIHGIDASVMVRAPEDLAPTARPGSPEVTEGVRLRGFRVREAVMMSPIAHSMRPADVPAGTAARCAASGSWVGGRAPRSAIRTMDSAGGSQDGPGAREGVYAEAMEPANRRRARRL